MSEYPMCEKLSTFSEERHTLSEFFEWCSNKGWHLAEYEEGANWPTDIRKTPDAIILDFLEVDAKVLEDERRTMLSKLQEEANKGKS